MGDAQFLYSQLDTLLAGPGTGACVGLVVDSARRTGVRRLLGASAGRAWRRRDLPGAVARDLGLRGARADRRRGRRARHELRGRPARHTRAACSARTACCTTRCCAGSPIADAPALSPTSSPASPARSPSTAFAAATSWTPTPVRSQTVSWVDVVRPGAPPAQIGRARPRGPRAPSACWSSPSRAALVERVDREDVGTSQQLGIELLLARAVGPDRRDVRAGRDPARHARAARATPCR